MNIKNENRAIIDAAKEDHNDLVINYLRLRQALGWMGISLPIILIICSYAWNGNLEASISNYFYTVFRDIFVVILCCMALFLFTYKGYDKIENRVTNLAGTLGFITAFAATSFKHDITLPAYDVVDKLKPYTKVPLETSYKIIPSPDHDYIGYIHLGCAASFFLCFAYLSFFRFSKSDNPKKNRLFKTCGIIIFIVILSLLPGILDRFETFYNENHLIFWGETICLWVFGLSWLVKGKTFERTQKNL